MVRDRKIYEECPECYGVGSISRRELCGCCAISVDCPVCEGEGYAVLVPMNSCDHCYGGYVYQEDSTRSHLIAVICPDCAGSGEVPNETSAPIVTCEDCGLTRTPESELAYYQSDSSNIAICQWCMSARVKDKFAEFLDDEVYEVWDHDDNAWLRVGVFYDKMNPESIAHKQGFFYRT